jgi:hypothetical protein
VSSRIRQHSLLRSPLANTNTEAVLGYRYPRNQWLAGQAAKITDAPRTPPTWLANPSDDGIDRVFLCDHLDGVRRRQGAR